MSLDYSLLLSQLEKLEADPTVLSHMPEELRERLSHVARLVSVRLEKPSELLARVLLCQVCLRLRA